MTESGYRGRFAPSPTGPLHFGSLIAATASYLQARHQGGQWYVRIEDIDPPREIAGASDSILRTLEAFGFEWDGPVIYQSQRLGRYQAALDQLREQDWVYPCACSRKEISETSRDGIYPGTCRQGLVPGQQARAWRLRVPDQVIEFPDIIQGLQRTNLAEISGDFVLLRADGHFAYQLCTALDDAEQGITEVVRGADLLDSTPRQRHVQRALGLASPAYAHHPVALAANGEKLSKQNLAPAVMAAQASPLLHAALRFLGQPVPDTLRQSETPELWHWAITHWDITTVPALHGAQLAETI